MAGEEIGSLIINIGAEVASLRAGMNDAVSILKRSQGLLSNVAKGIGLGIGAALTGATLEAIRGLPEALSGAVHRGEELGSIAEAFEHIGGSSAAIDRAKEATLGLVSSFDLMKIANEGLLAGIPDLNNQFSTIADYAARLADATGRDTTEAISTLVNAIAAGQPKMLAAQKIIVDSEAAYRKYADANNLVAGTLTKLQQKEAIQFEALSKVEEKLQSLGPVSGSVANSMDAVGVSMSEVTAKFDIALNSNVELQGAFDELRAVIDQIDFSQLAADIGSVAAALVSMASTALPQVIQYFHEFSIGVDTLRGAMTRIASGGVTGLLTTNVFSLRDAFNEAGKEVMEMRAQTQELSGLTNLSTTIDRVGESIKKATSQKDIDALAPKIAAISSETLKLGVSSGALYDKMTAVNVAYGKAAQTLPEVESAQARIARLSQHAGDESEKAGQKAAAAAKKMADEAKRAAEEVAKLTAQWQENFRTLSEDILDEQLELEIKDVELGGAGENFDKFIKEKSELIREGLQDALSEAVEKGALTQKQADTYADVMVERGVKVWTGKLKEAHDEFSEKAAEKYSEEMKDAIGDLGDSLGKVFDKLGVDLGDTFKILTENWEQFGEKITETLDDIAKVLGIEGGGKDLVKYLGTGLQVVGDALDAKGADKASKSNKGTGKAVGGAIGTAIGAIWGPAGAALGQALGAAAGSVIGNMFKWGPQNPETKARHAFANWIEDQFKKLGEVSLVDAQGKVRTFMGEQFNFFEGATDRFNSGKWREDFKKWGAEAEQTFVGLGEALEEVLGLTEDVGEQIGYLLGSNLSGNVDNARYLVQMLGLDMQEMIDKLVEAGVRGEMSWLEVTSAIAGVQNAFKPGLVAVGAFAAAFDNIIASGGQGYDAIKALKDIAVEAGEAGLNSLEALKQQLIASGKDPAQIESLFTALQNAGLNSIQAIADASTQTLGSVIAGMESSNKELASSWQAMRDEIEGVGEALAALPDEKEIILRVKTEIDDPAKKLLEQEGGTTQGSYKVPIEKTNAAQGYNGPRMSDLRASSVDMPRRARDLNGARAFQINIDARGASPGVEENIYRAVQQMQEEAIARTLEIVGATILRN